jgi:hypothetical protein
MRAAAEVDEVGSQRVLGENLVGLFLDELHFHPVVSVFFEAFGFHRELALVRQAFRLQLPHASLNLLEVFGSERRLALKIVVETRVGGRTNAELGFRKQLEHGGGQQVRGRVAVDLQRLGILRSQNLNLGVAFERASQIVELTVHARHHGVVGQPRADRLGDVQRPASRRHLLLAAIWQCDGETFAH